MVTVEFVFVNLWQRFQVPDADLCPTTVWRGSLRGSRETDKILQHSRLSSGWRVERVVQLEFLFRLLLQWDHAENQRV